MEFPGWTVFDLSSLGGILVACFCLAAGTFPRWNFSGGSPCFTHA